jgi:hypothetical protein
MSSLDYSKTYSSYSGVDIKVVVGGKEMGSMQAISYAIQREKAPIYVMGSVDPISFSRGKRGIAGTMISLMLDKHFLEHDGLSRVPKPLLDNNEVFAKPGNAFGEASLQDVGGATLDSTNNVGTATSGDFSNDYATANPFYVDQILPFDVSIVAVNEYGQKATMQLFGCEILNEGSGFSIDDIVVENQMTYVCRTILPWTSSGSNTTAASRGTGTTRIPTSNNQTSNPPNGG